MAAYIDPQGIFRALFVLFSFILVGEMLILCSENGARVRKWGHFLIFTCVLHLFLHWGIICSYLVLHAFSNYCNASSPFDRMDIIS